MTKKDYELLAAALRQAFPMLDNDDQRMQWAVCVGAVAAALAKDNPRFNPEKFTFSVKPY
jgi:hypothetical protein